MVISFNTGKVETTGGSGTGLLQQKKVTITENGLDVVVPDAGYDGLSTVYVKTYVSEPSGMKDFSVLGYDEELNISLNEGIDADIAYSKELYDAWNPDNTSAYQLFENDKQLVYAPEIDTSNVTDFGRLFYNCENLKYVPSLITNNVTTMWSMFQDCITLTEIDTNLWNTSNCKNFSNMCRNCLNLGEIGDFDTSAATQISYLFYCCTNLKILPKISVKSMPSSCFTNLTSSGAYLIGGSGEFLPTNIRTFKGIVDCEHITSWGGTSNGNPFRQVTNLKDIQEMGTIRGANFNLSYCNNLTVESLMVVINALYDFVGNGSTSTQSIKLGSTNLAKLSDEQKAIATAKGWTLS